MKKLLYFVMSFSLLLSITFINEVSANVDNDLVEKKEKSVEELKEDENNAKDEIKSKEQLVEEAMLEIKTLEHNKEDVEEEIKKNKRKIKTTKEKLSELNDDVKELEESIEDRRDIVGERMRSHQREGKLDYLDVLFGSENFANFISRANTLSIILEADNDIVTNFMNDVDTVERKIDEVEQVKQDLERIKEDNEDNKSKLSDNIEKTNDKKDKLNKQIDELNIKTEDISAERDKLIDEINTELGMKEELNDGELEWPTDKGRISSGVGHRVHPKTGEKGKFHKGIDIARTDKSVSPPIYAAEDGTVTQASEAGGYGNLIVIEHDDSAIDTKYAHLAEFNVKEGQKVRRGQEIGTMGTTGLSTGIHLHFEVYNEGVLQNPLRYVK